MNKRVRTGCGTCRKRRVKCDETRPTCIQYRSANFLCDGYEDPRRVTNSSPAQASTFLPAPSPERRVPELAWRRPNWRQDQLPLYHQFVTSTVFRLFRVDHVSFWRDEVAQISYGTDMVYEALLAISAAHRAALLSCTNRSSQEAMRLRVYGLGAYGRTLQLLASDLQRNAGTEERAVLIVLLLLAYFEVSHLSDN
jgi:hypothetical protein